MFTARFSGAEFSQTGLNQGFNTSIGRLPRDLRDSRESFRGRVAQIHQRGHGILGCTAAGVADRIVILRQGRLQSFDVRELDSCLPLLREE